MNGQAHTLKETLAFVKASVALNKLEPASPQWVAMYVAMWQEFPVFMERAKCKRPPPSLCPSFPPLADSPFYTDDF